MFLFVNKNRGILFLSDFEDLPEGVYKEIFEAVSLLTTSIVLDSRIDI